MPPTAKRFRRESATTARAISTDPPVDAEQVERGLLLRLIRHDMAALDEVLALFWGPLVGYLIGWLETREAAEDIAQEAFYRLWERRATLRPDGSLRGFLYHVARNMAISERRSDLVRERTSKAVQLERAAFTYMDVEHDWPDEELMRAVRRLPERRREIVLLRSVNDLSYKEIASLLGIAPQTVANHFSAALSDLRRALRGRALV